MHCRLADVGDGCEKTLNTVRSAFAPQSLLEGGVLFERLVAVQFWRSLLLNAGADK